MSTIFTKIVNGEIPCHSIFEDDKHLAFLDVNPLTDGHTLLIPKFGPDDIFDIPGDEFNVLWKTAQKVAAHLKQTLACKKVAIMVLGFEVPHAHIHLIPCNSESEVGQFFPKKPSDESLREIANSLRIEAQDNTPLTTLEVSELWNNFAEYFTDKIEPTTLTLAESLFPHLKLHDARSILEIGCGGGATAEALSKKIDSSAELTVCDLSTEMIGIARNRLKDDIITFLADAQSLPFENESYDRVLANLNLNLIPDTEACLREAHRVLKTNGRIVYSVWGRQEHSPLMTILPNSAIQLGVPLPKRGRSNFHLGTGLKLKSMMENCGFSNVLQWYQPMIKPIFSGEEYVAWMKNQLEMLDLQETIKNDLIEIMANKADALLSAGQPISLDVRVVIGQKI